MRCARRGNRDSGFRTINSVRTLGGSIASMCRRRVVEGQPRFQYGGYWFALSDAWPVGWAYTDDCYIDYIDGEYVLIDLLHPGVQIALIAVG